MMEIQLFSSYIFIISENIFITMADQVCGLNQQQIIDAKCVGSNGRCTAEGEDGTVCNARLADHPAAGK